MGFTEEQIKSLSPTSAAFSAGKKLANKTGWDSFDMSDRALWGAIKGSGKKPYMVQIDLQAVAYKCSCPSRQFPCKHAIGLLLLQSTNPRGFTNKDEPEWVSTWLNNRKARQERKEETPIESSPEQVERSAKNKEKADANRLTSVIAGAKELELWVKDLIRIGLLELPNKSKADFEKMTARMVDAKAPGLGGWIRTLSLLDFQDQDKWQDEALEIISKLYLLLQNIINIEKLEPIWQQTIRNLSGWSQSTKELLANNDAETIKDHWLVIGQSEEVTDEITTQRNWLIGCESGRQALILNFATKYSTFESQVLVGSLLEAELAFFPSVQPYRAAVKMQKGTTNELNKTPHFFDDFTQVHLNKIEQLKVNPWSNDHLYAIRSARLVTKGKQWQLVDGKDYVMDVHQSFDLQQCLSWLALSGNNSMDFACVIRNGKILPLGLFEDAKYKVL